ncbi:MAG: hypothetical protein ACRD8K_06845 [Nitrososphaeraceae archaeon]
MESDRVLEYLVQKVEETGIGHNVTLYVQGLIVNGALMHSKEYYDMITEYFNIQEISTNDQTEINMVKKYNEDAKQFMKDMIRQSKIDGLKYIHLRYATIKSSTTITTESIPVLAPVWRCKISSVDAFSIGIAKIEDQ